MKSVPNTTLMCSTDWYAVYDDTAIPQCSVPNAPKNTTAVQFLGERNTTAVGCGLLSDFGRSMNTSRMDAAERGGSEAPRA
jgi:hypothetical protein